MRSQAQMISVLNRIYREGQFRLKLAAAWATLAILLIPLSAAVIFGLPQRLALVLIVVGTLPIHYVVYFHFTKRQLEGGHRAKWRPQSMEVRQERHSVADDWIRSLPKDKNEIFEAVVGSWESQFAMLSVCLNEALSLRATNESFDESLKIAIPLFERLTVSLVACCESMARSGRRTRAVPLVEPLRVRFFRGNTGQTAATWNAMLHHLAFGDRQRFIQKLRIVSGTIEQLELEFEKNTKQLIEQPVGESSILFNSLDHLHYDFNTCLREVEVVLKSFLRVQPTEECRKIAYLLGATTSERVVESSPRSPQWLRLTYGLTCEHIVLGRRSA